jgi:hypothetical protein
MFHTFNNWCTNFLFFISLLRRAVRQNREHHRTRGNPWWRGFLVPWKGLWALARHDGGESADWRILAPDWNPYDPTEGWTGIGVEVKGEIIPLTLYGFGCLYGDGTPETKGWGEEHYYWVVQTPGGKVPLPMVEGLMW